MMYPYIQVPIWYQELITSIPAEPQKPTNPAISLGQQLRNRGYSLKIEPPKTPAFAGVPRLIFCIIVFCFSLKYYLVLLIGGSVVGFFVSIGEIININDLNQEYEKKLKNLKRSSLSEEEYCISQYSSSFENIIRTYYEKDIPFWKKDLAEYERKLNTSFPSHELYSYKLQKLNDIYVCKYCECDYEDLPRKGSTESKFYNYLKKNLNGVSVIINQSVGNFYPAYVPDVIINVNEFILLDIEIDEPYIMETGVPIHYISADDNRNNFFCEEGWFKIRFSEFQVMYYPEICLKIIRQVIEKAIQLEELNIDFDYENFHHDGWTYDEAVTMADFGFRQKKYRVD